MIRATRNMLDFFERKGMKYSPDIDTTKAGKDVVTVTYTGDNKDTIRFKIFVDPDEDNVAIRVWTIGHCRHGAERPEQQLPLVPLVPGR